jgi:hypothetical protein
MRLARYTPAGGNLRKNPITQTNPRRIQKFRKFSKMFLELKAKWGYESSNRTELTENLSGIRCIFTHWRVARMLAKINYAPG